MAPACRLVGLASAGLTWVQWSLHLLLWLFLCSILFVPTYASVLVREAPTMCHYFAYFPFVLLPERFLSSKLLYADHSAVVGMYHSHVGDIETAAKKPVQSPVCWHDVLMPYEADFFYYSINFLLSQYHSLCILVCPFYNFQFRKDMKWEDWGSYFTWQTKTLATVPCSTMSVKAPPTILLIGVLTPPFFSS